MKLLFELIAHQWKQARRSSIWQKNLAVNLIMGFFFFILFVELVVLAFFLGHEWHEIVDNPIHSLHKFVAWYIAALLAVRFFFQKLPALSVRPYQHLPIRKSSLIHFLLMKGWLNFYVLLSFIIFLPFAVFQVEYYHGSSVATLWLAGILALDAAGNYAVFYAKKMLSTNLTTVSLIVLAIALLAAGDYLGWYSYSGLIATLLDYAIARPVWLWLLILIPVVFYHLNFRFLKSSLYLEGLNADKSDNHVHSGRIGYLQKLGLIGELMSLDIRMYLRNKRTKSILWMTPLFLGYGLFFYPNSDYTSDSGFMIFIGMFVTSVMMINYLQYAFSFEGGFFDLLSTSGLSMEDYLKAKLGLAYALGIASFVITVPYVYFGMNILIIHTACILFSLGVIAPAILYTATYNKKTMVLTQGSAFNYQGIGATHFFIMIPVFILPLMIYLPFKWLGYHETGWLVLAGLGLAALPFRKFFIQLCLQNLRNRKYIMAEGFRERN